MHFEALNTFLFTRVFLDHSPICIFELRMRARGARTPYLTSLDSGIRFASCINTSCSSALWRCIYHRARVKRRRFPARKRQVRLGCPALARACAHEAVSCRVALTREGAYSTWHLSTIWRNCSGVSTMSCLSYIEWQTISQSTLSLSGRAQTSPNSDCQDCQPAVFSGWYWWEN